MRVTGLRRRRDCLVRWGLIATLALILGLVMFAGTAMATAPQTESYSGFAYESPGTPSASATYAAAARGRIPLIGPGLQSVLGADSAASLNRYDDTDSYLLYSGTWRRLAAGSAYGGSYASTDSAGSSVTVNFNGTYVAWVSWKDRNYGKARLTLDGVDKGTVDLYSSSTSAQVMVWNSGTLGSGYHTLKIECTGTKNASSGGYYINVDAFDVDGILSEQGAAGTGVISGKVTNSAGTGLANVYVLAWDEEFNIIADTVTSSSGAYSLSGLPNVPLILSTYNERNYIDEWYNNVRLPGNWDAAGATWLDLGSTATRTGINFSLATGRSISGYVHGADGAVFVELEVAAFDLSGNYVGSGITDASGNYTIWGLPAGQYRIRTVDAAVYVDEWYNNDPVLTDLEGESATTINISTSNATGKNFVLDYGSRISGRVTDSLGTGLADVSVVLRPPSHDFSVYVLTDEYGYYDFDGLLLGQYLLNTFNYDGYVDEWYLNTPVPGDILGERATIVDLTPIFQTGIDFALDKGYTISGTVVDDATGQALPDPGVMVEVVDGTDTLYSPGFAADDVGKAYTTWALPAGTYYVRTLDDMGLGYIDEWFDGLPLGENELADATPVHLTNTDVTGVDFSLARLSRYEQTDPHIYYTPAWTPYSAPLASGGSYSYSSATNAAATIYFNGIRLDAAVMKGTTTGSADFYVDDVKTDTINLAATVATYNVKVFTTGILPSGPHKVEIKYTSTNASGKRITLDAVDVAGVLTYAPPVITALSSHTGSSLGGDTVVITGANLSGATSVTFGGIPAASVTVNSATQITAVTPAHGAGTVQVQVTTPAGATANTAADDFTYAAPGTPTITSLSPNTGSVDGGTQVTINGSDFSGLSGAAAVTFGGLNATTYEVNSSTKITAVAPAHSEGTVRVKVVAAGGTTADLPTADFTYTTTPPVTRYDQPDLKIVKTGSWANYTSAASYMGTYGRSNTTGATATVWFSGTQIDWIAMTGTTTGTADVYVDGAKKATVNLASSPAKYQQNVWSSGPLSPGLHSFKIVNTSTKYVTLDAVDIAGTISAPPTRYEQTDTRIAKVGSWSNFSSSKASGTSYGRSLTGGASASVTFNGSRLDWIAMKGTSTGYAMVYLDNVLMTPTPLDLTATTASYQVMVWSTGDLGAPDVHTVRIERYVYPNGTGSTKYITLDAVDIWETVR